MSVAMYVNFPDAAQAEKVLGALIDHGALKEGLTAFFPRDYFPADSQGTDVDKAVGGITTTTGEDAAEGANTGARVGFGLGILAVLVSLAIPGFGLVTGGSALTSALTGLAGATAGGALAGGVAGFLQDQGVAEHVARQSEDAIKNGRALLIVNFPECNLAEEDVRILVVKYNGVEFGREEVVSPIA